MFLRVSRSDCPRCDSLPLLWRAREGLRDGRKHGEATAGAYWHSVRARKVVLTTVSSLHFMHVPVPQPNDGYACANLSRLAAFTSVGHQKLVAFLQSSQAIDDDHDEVVCSGSRDFPRPRFSCHRCAHCFSGQCLGRCTQRRVPWCA